MLLRSLAELLLSPREAFHLLVKALKYSCSFHLILFSGIEIQIIFPSVFFFFITMSLATSLPQVNSLFFLILSVFISPNEFKQKHLIKIDN